MVERLPAILAPNEDLEAFSYFCSKLTLQQKRPLVLEPFQERLLAPFFGGAIETVIVIPKKNGKSVLIAALALWDLFTTDNADVVIIASSVNQAKIIFNHARGFITRSPDLQTEFDVKPGFNEIRARRDMGRVRVMAADENTADGIEPTLGIIEEFHRHKNSELYGIVRDGLDTRGGRMVTITTAGASELSPLGRLRERAREFPVQYQDGAYLFTLSADGLVAFHEFALAPSDDLSDMVAVKSANPLSAQTIVSLKARYDSRQTESRWARFACGVWVRGDDSAIKPQEWDALEDPSVAIPAGAPVWLGLDLGWTGDPTAIVPVWWETATRRVVGSPVILEPAGNGERLDDRAVEAALLHLAGIETFDRRQFERSLAGDKSPESIKRWADAIEQSPAGYQVRGVVFDPNAEGSTIAFQFQRTRGIRFVEFKQVNDQLARADARLMEAIRRKEIVHNGHDVLREHVLNAIEVPVSGERFYFGHAKGQRRPNDALRALSMAHDAACSTNGTRRTTSPMRVYF